MSHAILDPHATRNKPPAPLTLKRAAVRPDRAVLLGSPTKDVLAPLDHGDGVGSGLPPTDGDPAERSYESRHLHGQVKVGLAIPEPCCLSHANANAKPRRDDAADLSRMTPFVVSRDHSALLNEFVICLAVPITAPGFDAADRRASEIITTAEAGPGEFEDALLAALRGKQAGIAARGRAELAEPQRKAGAL